MKHIIKIIINILVGLFISAFSFCIFFIFINDPFIKFAPENTEVYSIINLNQKLNKNINNDMFFNLKNIEINKILNDKEFEKIQKDYISKIGIILTKDNSFYIILKQKPFKKNIENIDAGNISNEISNYTNLKIQLESVYKDNYLFITNSKYSINSLEENKYKFFINNTKKLLQEKEFNFLLENHLVKTFFNTDRLNKYLDNLFIKDYSLSNIDIKNNILSINISNTKNTDNALSLYGIKDLDNNYLSINNINIYDFINKFLQNYQDKDMSSSENINYFLKNIESEDVDLKSLKKILSNESKVIVEFKDSDLNIDKVNKFIIITKLDNLENYIDDIAKVEKVFLRQLAIVNPKIERINIEDGLDAKEEKIDYTNLSFKNKEIANNILDTVKYLDTKNYTIYYSTINKDGLFVFSNSEDFLNKLSYNPSSLNKKYLFHLKNIKFDISIDYDENTMNFNIK